MNREQEEASRSEATYTGQREEWPRELGDTKDNGEARVERPPRLACVLQTWHGAATDLGDDASSGVG